jgi:hypothetical protein
LNRSFSEIISNLKSVSLTELECVSLQNRIDSKYLLSSSMLNNLLPFITENYKVLEIDDNRIFTYENNYFDTEDLLFYHEHHNGYLNRIKVRSRKYLETGSSFFEIKKKEKIERTNKIREKTEGLISVPNQDMIHKISLMSRKALNGIHKVLSNHFNRITFVNNAATERMTLDFNISFADENSEKKLEDIFVLEIKQSKCSEHSSINQIIRNNNIRQQGFSKYIYGVMLLKSGIKKNNFLPLLKKINTLR